MNITEGIVEVIQTIAATIIVTSPFWMVVLVVYILYG